MRTNIWIPKDIKPAITKAARKATKSGGIGAYLVRLHKAEENRSNK